MIAAPILSPIRTSPPGGEPFAINGERHAVYCIAVVVETGHRPVGGVGQEGRAEWRHG